MPLFNTQFGNLPSSSAATQTVGSFVDWPVLALSTLGTDAFNLGQQGNRVTGFSGGGDYIELPISAVTDIEYFNSSDASQWTVAIADVDASIDDWVGFTFDNDVIYGVAVDEVGGLGPGEVHRRVFGVVFGEHGGGGQRGGVGGSLQRCSGLDQLIQKSWKVQP